MRGAVLQGPQSSQPFAAPWEARVFAMVVQLNQNGHFSWGEWVHCFAHEVAQAAQAQAAGLQAPAYYAQWLAATEKILVAKSITSTEQLRCKGFAASLSTSSHKPPPCPQNPWQAPKRRSPY